MSGLLRTPLYERHEALGARMVDFAGFSMPVQYTSIKDEHAAVRHQAGLFDVSHMGQIHLSGPAAIACAEKLLTCPVSNLRVGRVRYGLLCHEDGGCVDDVTVYRESEDSVFLCVNAANIKKDRIWIERHATEGTVVDDRSAETALLALQGPKSAPILTGITSDAQRTDPVSSLGRFRFERIEVAGVPALVSRTGYTGSDGFEIYLPSRSAVQVFDALLDTGADQGLTPAGLGARDTLRLEAALPLYGHELDDQTSPLEAGLARFVKLQAGGFIGAAALQAQDAEEKKQQLIGFVVEGRGIARAGYPIAAGGTAIGTVTSGGPSPSLGSAIGLGYVPPEHAEVGSLIDVVIRDRAVPVRVVQTPFIGNP